MKPYRAHITIGLSALIVLTSPHVSAFGDLFSDEDSKALMGEVNKSLSQATDSPLSNLLSDQLAVTPEQATSGGAAMLALAQSSLSTTQNNELASLIPGLDNLTGASNLLGGINSLSAVNDVFEKIGLDPSMVAQFAPVILGYLTEQGASSGLLNSLSGLWS